MADAEERKDDRRNDAGEHVDKMISAIDALCKRMDAMEDERKSEKEEREKADKARKDAARKDNEGKEGGDHGEDPEEGDAKDVVADKARKDAEGDLKKSEKEEEKREEREKADAARADAEIQKRVDAALAARLAEIERRIPKMLTDADYHAMADAQSRADSVYNALGKRSAPRPLEGETPATYRRRLARELQTYSKDFGKIDLGALNDDAFGTLEGKIYADAQAYAAKPDDLGDGELREVRRKSSAGHQIVEFYGRQSFIAGMKPPTQAGRLADPKSLRF